MSKGIWKNKNEFYDTIKRVLYIVYFVVFIIFAYSITRLPSWIQNAQANYAVQLQAQIEQTIRENPTTTLKEELATLGETFSFEVAVFDGSTSVYQTIPNLTFANFQAMLNKNAVAVEVKGSLENVEGKNLLVWYSVYYPRVTDYMTSFATYQFLLVFFCFLVLLGVISLFYRYINKPLKALKANLHKLEKYQLSDMDEAEMDLLNIQVKNFATDLEHRFELVSQNYTELEYSLQEEKERLANLLLISKGVVHDLKTPIHKAIIDNDLLLTSEKINEQARGIAEYNIKELTKLMNQVNEVLELLKSDMKSTLTEKVDFDVIALLKDIQHQLRPFKRKKDLWVDIEAPEKLFVHLSRPAIHLILHNMLTNAIKYANDNSAIDIEVDELDKNLLMVVTNETTEHNIERISQSEHLLFIFDEEDAEFSSGNGMYLIKQLTEILGGTYTLDIAENIITVIVQIPL